MEISPFKKVETEVEQAEQPILSKISWIVEAEKWLILQIKYLSLMAFNLLQVGFLAIALRLLQYYGILYQNTPEPNLGVLIARNISITASNVLGAMLLSSVITYTLCPCFYKYENPYISKDSDVCNDFRNLDVPKNAIRFYNWLFLRLLFFVLAAYLILAGDKIMMFG